MSGPVEQTEEGRALPSDRATRARTEPASGLGHSAGIPSAIILWHPIETAPKDGTKLLLCLDPWQPATGLWTDACEDDGGCWTTAEPSDFESDEAFRDYLAGTFYTPTHWSPLPLTPTEQAQAIEARRAETTGSARESAVPQECAQSEQPS